jgi:hypothetical protein
VKIFSRKDRKDRKVVVRAAGNMVPSFAAQYAVLNDESGFAASATFSRPLRSLRETLFSSFLRFFCAEVAA